MKKHKIPAIVFGGGINGLGIARNLGKEGVNVYSVVDHVDAVVFSRYCQRHYLIPGFRRRKDLISAFLDEFSRKETTRAVVFSTDDLSTLVLADLKREMKDDYCFVLPEKETAEKIVIKRRFYESLIERKIPHPRVIIPASVNDFGDVGRELGFPILVKPSITQTFAKLFGTKGFVAYSTQDIAKYHRLATRQNVEVFFQEIIPGIDENLHGLAGFFNRKSNPLALFAYRRLRGWPHTFGNNSLMESIPVSRHPVLREIVCKYLKCLRYYGIMEAEFKLDPRDLKFKLLEINARSWWQNAFPTKCGLNIILKAYLDAIGEDVEYSEDYVSGAKWIHFLNDLRSSFLNRDLLTKKWAISLKGVRDFAYFDIHDLGPLVTSMFCEVAESLLH